MGLDKGKATHSCILAWRIPWAEESGRLQSWGPKESDTTERLTQHLEMGHAHLSFIISVRVMKNYSNQVVCHWQMSIWRLNKLVIRKINQDDGLVGILKTEILGRITETLNYFCKGILFMD